MRKPISIPAPCRLAKAGTRFLGSAAALMVASSACAADLGYLQGLLNATPTGGWVRANTNAFADAWATGDRALPPMTHAIPSGVVTAWSSFAWDSVNGNLLLWGGGHATYFGNEMYVWNGASGQWTAGSLPSRIEWDADAADPRTYLVAGDGAPQSAHTYDNNVFLPQNNLFMTFGGAVYNTGGNFEVVDGNGGLSRAGPWAWDPNKADPNKVGGADGTGYGANSQGGHMWTNLGPVSGGTAPADFIEGTTAYRQEGGKDVIYLTAEPGTVASGWQGLYRYTAGDLRNGGTATWEHIGISSGAPAFLGAAAIDSALDLYVRTTHAGGDNDLAVWDLDKSDPLNPESNRNVGVQLVHADGTPFVMTENYGIDYDTANGTLVLWDNTEGGKVYIAKASRAADGSISSVWTVHALMSATAEQPASMVTTGVLGKWEYVPELGAFIALTGATEDGQGADVWLYKTSVTAVPEPAAYALLLSGLAVVAWRTRRRPA